MKRMKMSSGSGGGGGEGAGFVRADQIDLKSIDEQLQRYLGRAWTEKQQKNNDNQKQRNLDSTAEEEMEPVIDDDISYRDIPIRYDWEIDPSKLTIKAVIARGTFGTVHRGVYDGQDVAGSLFQLSFFLYSFFSFFFILNFK